MALKFGPKLVLLLMVLPPLFLAGCITQRNPVASPTPTVAPSVSPSSFPAAYNETPGSSLKQFKSGLELASFLRATQQGGNYGGYGGLMREAAVPLAAGASQKSADSNAPASSVSDYSTTNVQVAGVDEPDILKNDGNYLYAVAGGNIVILKAAPASDLKVVSNISVSGIGGKPSGGNGANGGFAPGYYAGDSVNSIFVNGDKLVAFGTANYPWPIREIPMIRNAQVDKALAPPNQSDAGGVQADSGVSGSSGSAPASGAPGSFSGSGPTSVSEAPSGSAAASSGSVPAARAIAAPGFMARRPYWYGGSSFVRVYDISDRANPEVLKTVVFNGNYADARMIGSRVFTVVSQPAYYGGPVPLLSVDGKIVEVDASEVSYFDYPSSGGYQFTILSSIDLADLSKDAGRKVVLVGGAQTIYVSQENAYVTYARYDNYLRPLYEVEAKLAELVKPNSNAELEGKLKEIDDSDASAWVKASLKNSVIAQFIDYELSRKQQAQLYRDLEASLNATASPEQSEFGVSSRQRTVVHKFSLGNGAEGISYAGEGEVPGTVLNQFSLDEKDGYLRIATTTPQEWGGWEGGPFLGMAMMPIRYPPVWYPRPEPREVAPSKNHLYVLDSGLKLAGKLENLAPGERIYSVRFMGDRAYMVTFRQLDPLFVISLSDPRNPEMLGKLKIPGYSDYLHPYDGTHLIGLGKDALPVKLDANGEEAAAFPTGLKLSLFDVSDVANPRETATLKLGDAGTDSNALHDHKAFLFSREKGIIVIPVLLAELNSSKYPAGEAEHVYGDYAFQGAYVINVSLDSGFSIRGRVTHATKEELGKSGEYWYGTASVERSAYIGDALYTMSERYVKASDLASLDDIASVQVNAPYEYGGPVQVI